jgi:hypothetical protein
MRESNKGGFFCTRKMPDGTYCKIKIPAVPPPAPTPSATPVVGGLTDRGIVTAAALIMAKDLFPGNHAATVSFVRSVLEALLP